MSDIATIQTIERKIGYPLRQVTWQKFHEIEPQIVEKVFFELSSDCPDNSPTRTWIRRYPEAFYILDEQNRVTLFWLFSFFRGECDTHIHHGKN